MVNYKRMRHNLLITIVVPVYNAEHTLKRCMDSILSQTYKCLEIILVNDGSTDRSGILCDQYRQQDERIKVIHTKNNGSVTARKIGSYAASGDYVGFVDSDDYIDKNMYQSMYEMTEGGTCDMVGCGCLEDDIHNSRKILNMATPGIYEGEIFEKIKHCMMFDMQKGGPAVFQSVWSKIFKKDILVKVMESIDSQITIGDDAAVVYPFLLEARKIALSDSCFYHYVVNDNSMTHSNDCSIFEKIHLFQHYMTCYFEKCDNIYGLKKQLNYYMLHLIDIGIANVFGIRYKRDRILGLGSELNAKKVVLYGAGKVGKEYYLQILKKENIDIVAWVDKKLAGKEIYCREIQEPEIIKSVEFDYILTAVASEQMAEEIKDELTVFCDNKKIIWYPGSVQYSGEVEFMNEKFD